MSNSIINNFLSFIKRNITKILSFYLLFVLLLIVFVLKQGDDIMFHMERMDAIMQEFSNLGIKAFPIRIYHSVGNGYGYASPLFYCDIFFWPFAIVASVFKLQTIVAYKMMLCVILLVSCLLAKYAFALIFDEVDTNLVLFLYMFSVTIFLNSTGSWVGRFFATMFVPLSICSFYCLINKDDNTLKHVILLSVGVMGTLYSNVIDAAIVVVTLLIMFLFSIKKLNIKKLLFICLAAILCIMMSLWFLAPMIEQMNSQVFFVTSGVVDDGLKNIGDWTVPLLGVFFPREITRFLANKLDINGIAEGYFEGMLFYIVMFIFIIKYRKEISKNVKNMNDKEFILSVILILILYILFQTKLFPHNLLSNLIGVIQFPWRVNIVLTVCGAILTVMVFKRINKDNIIYTMLLLSMALTMLTFISSYGFDIVRAIKHGNKFADYSYNSYNIGTGEYLPIELYKNNNVYAWGSYLDSRGNDVLSENDYYVKFVKDFDSITVETNGSNDRLELPLIYYYGYSAIDEETGKQLPISKSSDGLVKIETKDSSSIYVSYSGTPIQKYSNYISLVSSISVLFIYICITKKKKSFNK